MQVLKRGAEAILYFSEYEGQKVLVKERIKKSYRIEELDKKLRKMRTRKEARLLTESRKVGVPTPKIFMLNEKNFKILMEYVDGVRVKELLASSDKKTVEKICFEIGRLIGKLHANNIIHGDLTTSNMIFKNGKIYFIDLGLGKFSSRLEDKGVDLNLLLEALKATHFKILNVCWNNIVKGYKKEYKDAEEVLRKVEEIEKRARYAKR